MRRLAPSVLLAVPMVLAALPAPAEGLLDRLRGLDDSAPTLDEIYAEEASEDRALIDALAPDLFDPARPGLGPAGGPVRIALFVSDDCADCSTARAELEALVTRLGLRATLFDVSASAADAETMRRLGLDLLPSYVMRTGMIRGAMPQIVLQGYLAK